MKKIRESSKIITTFLIIVFLLNICLAVNANTVNGKHSITIEGAGTGHEYVIYQIFTGNLNEDTDEMGDIKWGDGVDQDNLLTDLKQSTVQIQKREFDDVGVAQPTEETVPLKEIFSECDEAYEVAYALSPYENSSDVIREFAQIIGKHLQEDNAIKATESENKYTATGLATGYYFIKDNKGVTTEAQTRYILNLVKNSTITVKADAPTMELKVKNGSGEYCEAVDYQINDKIEFQMIGKLPKKSIFDDYEQYKYVFHISIPESLEYENDSFEVSLQKSGETTSITEQFTNDVQGDKITIGCDDIKGIDAISKLVDTEDTEIVVTYKTKLKGTANKVTKNKTTAYLEFSDNPNKAASPSTSKTLENSASVYTYILDIEKINGKVKSETLDGVGFKLYEGDLSTADGSKKWAKIVDGLIVEWVDNEEDATEMKTANGGKINIYGLDNKTYVLKETTTLDGFNTRDNMEFSINSTIGDSELSQGVSALKLEIKNGKTVEGELDGLKFTLQVLNYPGALLPETGGIGTVIFYIIGGIFLVSAIVLMLSKKKENE